MCTVCLEEFPSFYSLEQHKRRKHGTSTKVGTKSSEKLKKVLESEEMEKDNEQLQQKLSACQHFFDDTEMGNGTHQVFENFNCAAKVNLALGFILRNVDTDEYRYFYAHENNTFFEKYHLLCSKGDLVSLQDRIEKMDLVKTYAQERENTKWRFALTTNVKIFCALLTSIPMGFIDAVLPELLIRRLDVNCPVSNGYGETYKDYLCLFRAIAVTYMDHRSFVIQKALSFKKREISTAMLKRVNIEYSIFTQGVCIHCASLYSINLTDLKYLTTMIKNCSKTWLFFTSTRYVYTPSN